MAKQKKLYTVYITTDRKKPNSRFYNKYVHVGVKRMYRDENILYIEEFPFAFRTKLRHMYDLKHVRQILRKELDTTKKMV